MPLKRITFSGRLGPKAKEDDDYRKILLRGLIYMGLDIAITLAISIALFYMFVGYAISPYERPIPCNDDSINRPFQNNTVRMKQLLVISLGTPFFIICFVEALIFRASQGTNKLANYFTTSTLLYLTYLISFAVCTFLMEYLKCTIGRLRPHFLAVCQPDWSRMDCTDKEYIPVSETFCMNPDTRRIRTARTSFPSGHTAAAFHVWMFLGLYLCRMANITGIPSLYKTRNILLAIFTIWTGFTAISRITDYWHHPSDVLGGIVLAASCILPVFGRQWRTHEDVYGPRQLEKQRPHFE
nr:Phosphatidic acid phosphatase type 2 haloperoxidase domain containing protein [Haemonchus contortus]